MTYLKPLTKEAKKMGKKNRDTDWSAIIILGVMVALSLYLAIRLDILIRVW